MNAKNIILTLATAALLVAPVAVLAQGGPPPGHHGGPGFGPGPDGIFHRLPMLTEILDLSSDQVDQITGIFEAQRSEVEPLMEQMRTAREDFHSTTGPGSFDEATYRAFFERQAATRVEMHLIQAQGVAEAWAVLTPEQQQELSDLIEAGAEHRGGTRCGRKPRGR